MPQPPAPPFSTPQGKIAPTAAGVRTPTPVSGAHDFIKDPGDNAPKTGARDWTKENRPQRMGGEPTLNSDTVPAGGAHLKADPSGSAGNSGTVSGVGGAAHKPFRLKGDAADPMNTAPAGSVGEESENDIP